VRSDGQTGAGAARRRRGRPPTRAGRQERILEAAAGLIHAKGFQATTIQDVADEVEFSKAAFYYFVKNKEDLLYQILLRTLTGALEQVRAVVSGPGEPAEKLLQVVDAYARMVAERPDTFAVYFKERAHLAPAHRETVTGLERQIVAELRGVFSEGAASGGLRDLPPEAAVFGLLGMCLWTYEWYDQAGPLTPAELGQALRSLAAHGVVTFP
jgi:TetR/AcrR family transcriptional regulator, cholesterol catabolism regulator